MWKDIKKRLSDPESVISLILGIAVVVVTGVLLYNIFQTRTSNNKTVIPVVSQMTGVSGISGVSVQTTVPETPSGLPTKHKVQAGDDLWNIALKYYKSGYNWITIAKANNLANPDLLYIGRELNIPKAETIYPAGNLGANGIQTISGNSYTVKKDDNLWDISCRAYADCYKWSQVAKANNLANPNFIEVGQVLKLPR